MGDIGKMKKMGLEIILETLLRKTVNIFEDLKVRSLAHFSMSITFRITIKN